MALCRCDGPPHQFDPAWCVSPKLVDRPVIPTPMQPARPLGRDTLAAPRGSERAVRYAAIRRLDDGSDGARDALRALGVQDEEFGRW